MGDAGGAPAVRKARRSLAGAALDGVFVLLAVLTVATLFADQAWLPDMLSFFRPQLAMASAVLLLLALATRRLPRIAGAAVLAGLNFWPLAFTSVPLAAPATGPGPTVRVMSANLLGDTVDEAAFRRALGEVKPDLLVAQEVSLGWRKLLDGLPDLPYRASRQLRLFTAVDVVSRYPMTAELMREVPFDAGRFGGGLPFRITIAAGPFGARPLVIYAIHPPTPRTGAGWVARNRYLEAVAQRMAAEPAGALVIAAGDWNTPFWSPFFRQTLVNGRLFAAERSAWPASTRVFQEFGAPEWLGTPIDHIALSGALGLARSGRGPRTSSDHLPIFADIGLK